MQNVYLGDGRVDVACFGSLWYGEVGLRTGQCPAFLPTTPEPTLRPVRRPTPRPTTKPTHKPTPEPPTPHPTFSGDGYVVHHGKVGGFDGLDSFYADSWDGVSSNWCRGQCESINSRNVLSDGGDWCHGYDFDSNIDRCRIFSECPIYLSSESSVSCWLSSVAQCSVDGGLR